MMVSLASELRELVDRTLDAARLSDAERRRVRQELEGHFADGLAAGRSASALAEAFGDPAITGAMIRRARRDRERWRQPIAMAFAAAAACYIAGVVSVQSAPDAPATVRLAREVEQVFADVIQAETRLGDAAGLVASYRVAADLRRRRDYWSETAGVILLDRIAQAADSLLDERGRAWLRDSLRALMASEGLAPRRHLVEPMRPVLVEGLTATNGRIGREGRLLLVRAKGTHTPSRRALLLEPLYFALPISRDRMDTFVRDVSERRLAQADHAARRLAQRYALR